MNTDRHRVKTGQFSESPVLAVAKAIGLDDKFAIDWETRRVPSSPGQFDWLSNGEIDIAITSPDNVMLYATTDSNPLGKKLSLSILRTIDRGLGLSLFTSPEITDPQQLEGARFGVDVPNSGFAFLLFALAKKLGVERDRYELESVGATPKRLDSVLTGAVAATILNAETAVEAESQGLRKWSSSVDLSDDYLGTVLVQLTEARDERTEVFLEMWEEATDFILLSDPADLGELLSSDFPKLATSQYLEILKSREYGLLRNPETTLQQLLLLAKIRADFGAYTPTEESLVELLGGSK